MSNSGLTSKDQRMLERTLAKLDAVGTKRFLLGREGMQMDALAKRIRERLNPESASLSRAWVWSEQNQVWSGRIVSAPDEQLETA